MKTLRMSASISVPLVEAEPICDADPSTMFLEIVLYGPIGRTHTADKFQIQYWVPCTGYITGTTLRNI